MNTTKTTLTVFAVTATMLFASMSNSTAFGELEFEIEPYYEGTGFGMGYAYQCGAEYQYASGLTVLTIEKTPGFNDYVSVLGYYGIVNDANGEFQEYELTQQFEYLGNFEVMESIQLYWEDRYVSSIC